MNRTLTALAALALLAACATVAPDYAREQRLADEVRPSIVVGDAVQLVSVSGHRFLGIFTPASRPRPGLLLVHFRRSSLVHLGRHCLVYFRFSRTLREGAGRKKCFRKKRDIFRRFRQCARFLAAPRSQSARSIFRDKLLSWRATARPNRHFVPCAGSRAPACTSVIKGDHSIFPGGVTSCAFG